MGWRGDKLLLQREVKTGEKDKKTNKTNKTKKTNKNKKRQKRQTIWDGEETSYCFKEKSRQVKF